MSDPNAFTRREFLHCGLAMVSTVTTVPGFLSRSGAALAEPSARLVSRPGVPDERVLVVVQLSGGNDGCNTVVPFGMREYHHARPRLGIPVKDVITLDDRAGIGLHPAMADLARMMDQGLAAIVQGVGYPNPNRSHFASMDVWHTGDTAGGRGRGWIGRALDRAELPDASMACISIGSEAPMATQGKRVKPVVFERPESLRWRALDLDPALGDAHDALHESVGGGVEDPANDAATSFVFRTALDAQVAADRLRQAVGGRAQTSWPHSGLARQLKLVASMIKAELPTRVYYVALGGFDTHANQPGRHERLLREFSESMRAFYAELDATGHRGRVVTVAFSEFGRRLQQNASGGTDHGAAGPMFIFGDHLRKPGLLGAHPSLTRLDAGDLIHAVDFRSVYADVLDNWMKIDSAAVLGRKFTPAGILRA